MAALTTRKMARDVLLSKFMERLDVFIPLDESRALPGSTFEAFETQAEQCGLPLVRAMMEERSKLSEQALVTHPGRCPQCRSQSVYLRSEQPVEQRQSAYGPVSLRKQRCRCRDCGKTFSPSRP
jgi:Zn finger protein HypA/HybF involved in hydrogenase expression